MTVLIIAGLLGGLPALLAGLKREHLALLARPARKVSLRRAPVVPRRAPRPAPPPAATPMMSPARFAALAHPRKDG